MSSAKGVDFIEFAWARVNIHLYYIVARILVFKH